MANGFETLVPGARVRALVWIALALALVPAIALRGYWTPDEPREADIAWRMSVQDLKSVPSLAGAAFCEKPPLAYWLAGAAVAAFGTEAWAARLPNLLYALVTALAVGALARRAAGPLAGLVAAAAISTLLLAFQVTIWLATDAPLLAATSVALLGLYRGWYAREARERLLGYTLMHAGMCAAFMSKSAAGWMVPALAFVALVLAERRLGELRRPALWAGLPLQAAVILAWIHFVAVGPDGAAHLQVFFWNNLVGRFTHVDAPAALQYATGHRNTPGKYLLELPVYLWPWTLLAAAAVRRAWRDRRSASRGEADAVRFAAAVFLPTLALLSFAATARNVYLAPALPGVALLLGWWAQRIRGDADALDRMALKATAVLLLIAAGVLAAAVAVVGIERGPGLGFRPDYLLPAGFGVLLAVVLAVRALAATGARATTAALLSLLLAYAALLAGPAAQVYRGVNAWQDLGAIGRALRVDLGAAPLVLLAPDETTLALVDLYARPAPASIAGPVDERALAALARRLRDAPGAMVFAQLPGRAPSPVAARWLPRLRPAPDPAWPEAAGLRVVKRYELPNGRRYALLAAGSPAASWR